MPFGVFAQEKKDECGRTPSSIEEGQKTLRDRASEITSSVNKMIASAPECVKENMKELSRRITFKGGDRVQIIANDSNHLTPKIGTIVTIKGKMYNQDAYKIEGTSDIYKTTDLALVVDVLRGEKCPKCGEVLIVRKNSHNGRLFVGCSSFPKCNHTMSVADDIGSERGNRGVSELCNGVTVFYAESKNALDGYVGLKVGDIGVVKNKSHTSYYTAINQSTWKQVDIKCEDCGMDEDDSPDDDWDDDDDDGW